MNTQIHKTISFEYEKKRARALIDTDNRRKDIYLKYPDAEKLDEEIRLAGLRLAKTALKAGKDTGDKSIKELEDLLGNLKKKREELFAKLDIKSDSLEPVFECNICRDTGFVEDKNGEMCSCYKQKLINLAYKQANIHLLTMENFETFNIKLYSSEANLEQYGTRVSPRENILKIKERCLEFIKKFDDKSEKNLLFTGDTGLGKTFLANCITKELLDKGKTVIYQTAPRLLDTIMDYKMRYERSDNFREEEYENLFEVGLLVIDDLGAETLNPARLSELFTIINTRLLTRSIKGTKTLISTNLTLEKMNQHFDDRIMSRILGEFYICKFLGDDIRLKKGRA